MRLIDADKLLEGEHFILKCKSEFGVTEIDVFRREVIENAPTVERKPFATVTFDKDELDRIVEERVIEPIKNGELVIKEEKPHNKWGKWVISEVRCPNCLEHFDTDCYSLSGLDICPNCGALMIDE